MWEVFKGGEGYNTSLPIEYCDGKVGRFYKLEYLWVRVDSVVDIVLSNLYQVDNLVAIIWISSSEDYAVEIKVLLLINVKVTVHLFLAFNI